MTAVRRLPTWALVIALAAAYFVLGKLGLSLAVVNPSASAVWPPTGLALAAVLVLGARAWPGVFLGAVLVNFTTASSLPVSLAIAAGNTLEALAGAWLVNRFVRAGPIFPRHWTRCSLPAWRRWPPR
jgi:integral membrane sensor domain MASE1